MTTCPKCGMVPYGPGHTCADMPPGTVRGMRYVMHDFDSGHVYGEPCADCERIEREPPTGYYTISEVLGDQ